MDRERCTGNGHDAPRVRRKHGGIVGARCEINFLGLPAGRAAAHEPHTLRRRDGQEPARVLVDESHVEHTGVGLRALPHELGACGRPPADGRRQPHAPASGRCVPRRGQHLRVRACVHARVHFVSECVGERRRDTPTLPGLAVEACQAAVVQERKGDVQCGARGGDGQHFLVEF